MKKDRSGLHLLVAMGRLYLKWETEEALNNYAKLDSAKREQIFVSSFEWVTTNPDDYLDALCTHINKVGLSIPCVL